MKIEFTILDFVVRSVERFTIWDLINRKS